MAVAAGLGAVSGMSQAKKAEEKAANDNALNAELQRYSPWTGYQNKGLANGGPGMLAGGLSGAAGGLQVAQGLSKGGMFGGAEKVAPAAEAVAPVTPVVQDPITNSLGSNQMNAQLGQMGKSPWDIDQNYLANNFKLAGR